MIGPAIEVTTGLSALRGRPAVSHTAHAETAPRFTGMAAGAPGMPTSGPVGYLAISAGLTHVGCPAVPVASRADVKFSAGYNRPSMRA
ncbi:Uncharacterised protein [Mycobacterium tuberculosis]|uniref:Uncharacterized protein n=1 Tax=Mycobacterium tuberculosis TaxID=1773 RepID=A0A655A729_MYCTX|nr:hypothetical protein BBG46_20200 [Mycobacterium tuberculosis variant caprae]CFB95431.1 Uncharacterised protein [Mycobacterium tuberculosis]CKP02184.1 Uncharacterised protein [Mycobacterium tuberculosis]CKS40333.1 Uncharacterised protein [Mycobacterium tuberculosis]CKT48194.1 Uncharacterised protein [Mycobacterium tuberculosis]